MDEYLKQALEIIKAQASVRTMTEEEISSMMRSIALSIKQIAEGAEAETVAPEMEQDPTKVIKEKSITCLECGKAFKILTRKHLASHGLSLAEYREKYGYKKGLPLVCKTLQRERRKKMKDMKLWEKRAKAK
jgi:predicted transcriptional regulator